MGQWSVVSGRWSVVGEEIRVGRKPPDSYLISRISADDYRQQGREADRAAQGVDEGAGHVLAGVEGHGDAGRADFAAVTGDGRTDAGLGRLVDGEVAPREGLPSRLWVVGCRFTWSRLSLAHCDRRI